MDKLNIQTSNLSYLPKSCCNASFTKALKPPASAGIISQGINH